MQNSEKGKEQGTEQCFPAPEKVEYVQGEEKMISDELLKQKYLDDLNQFVIGEYSFMEEKMIHNFSNSQEYQEVNKVFPLKMVLKHLVKSLMINELEIIYLLHFLEVEDFSCSHSQMAAFSSLFNNSIFLYDGSVNANEYKQIYCALLFTALLVKYHVNDKNDLDVLNVFLQGILKVSQQQFYQEFFYPWQFGKSFLLTVSPNQLNKTYRKCCLMRHSKEVQSMKDYNNIVDQIINLAPPYFNEGYAKSSKRVKQEKKELFHPPPLNYTSFPILQAPSSNQVAEKHDTTIQNNQLYDQSLYSFQEPEELGPIGELSLKKGNRSFEFPQNGIFQDKERRQSAFQYPKQNMLIPKVEEQVTCQDIKAELTLDTQQSSEPQFLIRQDSYSLFKKLNLSKLPSELQHAFKNTQ